MREHEKITDIQSQEIKQILRKNVYRNLAIGIIGIQLSSVKNIINAFREYNLLFLITKLFKPVCNYVIASC